MRPAPRWQGHPEDSRCGPAGVRCARASSMSLELRAELAVRTTPRSVAGHAAKLGDRVGCALLQGFPLDVIGRLEIALVLGVREFHLGDLVADRLPFRLVLVVEVLD